MRVRCRLVLNITGVGFGKSLGPGAECDLDEVLGKDATGNVVALRDCVNPEWFEPLEAPAAEEPIAQDEE
jgi:hypothetical protein